MTNSSSAGSHWRRGAGFLLLTTFLPGVVQRYAGHRALGTIALRVWGVVVGIVVLLGLALWLFPGPIVGLLLSPGVAGVARILLWVVFVGWLVMMLDAWRLSKPMSMPQNARLGMTIAVVTLAATVGFSAAYVSSLLAAAANVAQVLPGGGETSAKEGRFNVLLLGVDAAEDRDGVRPDSINLVSIDAETGRTVVFGLPRNMQRVPFAEGSPMRKAYPNGFHCPDDKCMLNAVWTAGEDRAAEFPADVNPGLEATKAAVSETLGLEINYYALVDMNGFAKMVDALGGIQLDIKKRIPIGGGSSPVSGHIEPGEGVHLDGYHALWFARSRIGADDYERMQRQKCVLSAMSKQLDPQTVADRFVELSEAGKDLLKTDVPGSELVNLVSLAAKGKDLQVASINFSPPVIERTANPDFQLIRRLVRERISAAEQADEATPAAEAPTESAQQDQPKPAQPEDKAGPDETPEPYQPAGAVEDLEQVCSVSG
ncbi:LCP family protein [Tessaracoccus sp. OH4464_COT-324]|uniref:LCP family glycopolymer transferase n=1 Tax=Tessaracoccus sp. OH4464_COT-324 TaxID=2491059 RepID=UPI000F639DF4|nr:LCP family protein [Tessaracoccus sp. OH4464_COT-324]RRD46799.1 LytR family transcriptional regulator [Tessaracoccus sp. OH4464_COT-324]